MNSMLSKAIEMAQRLSDDEQEAVGRQWIAELESEVRWQKLFAESQDQLEVMARRALEAHKAGSTKPWPKKP